MKLAKKAFVITLTLLALIGMVSAQVSEDDPRNTAPTVGTGGPVGGPTGLFTVYDGQTLKKGEFTFSAAYSNYDRDPGDVDITEVPLSFQVGLTNNFELFFTTDLFRGVKTNSPRNLSGFYLPNSNAVPLSGTSGVLPAIVMAPGTGGGVLGRRAIFRPTGNQVFAQFPYVGASAGLWNFDVTNPDPAIGPIAVASLINLFGTSTPALSGISSGGNGADNFPGIGSAFGGILPGVVLQTITLPAAQVPGGIGPGNEAPTVFAIAPSYLPDAPLLNRTYGESAFSTFTIGGKWRFTSNKNPIGFGIIPFYRFYADKADDFGGFNQLQRGASPGGDIGDIGLILFADARVRKWLNISANIGYVYNSDIKGDFGGTELTLLDRGDEVQASIGLDFPVNKYFQPILEFRTLQYVGGRTYNAFENNPMDALAGVRIFPTRWMGFSLAYRYHANQQDSDALDNDDSQNNITVINGDGRALVVPPVITNFNGAPPGFRTSTDPHGFIVQGFIGRRNKRGPKEEIDLPANVTGVSLSKSTVVKKCAPGFRSRSGGCNDDMSVNVSTTAVDPEKSTALVYNYTVTGGRIVGQGANVSWDLSGASPGTYTITAGVDDGCGVCGDTKTATITVAECNDCEKVCECPTSVTVDEPAVAVAPGETMTFTANVVGGNQEGITYSWSVDRGSIIGSSTGRSITVSTAGLSDTTVTASLNVGGLCDECGRQSATGQGLVNPPDIVPLTPFDEFGAEKANVTRNRIDNFFIALQNDPSATGYIINYGSDSDVLGRRGRETLIRNHIAFRKYDINRVVFIRGSSNVPLLTKLYVVPAGVTPPTP